MDSLNSQDFSDLKTAKQLLEHPSIAARVADKIGMPIEKSLALLPEKWQDKIHEATHLAIEKAVEGALKTMPPERNVNGPQNGFHKVLVGTTGALGGFFGVPALLIELPASTVLMLRSIIDIARSEGEEITSFHGKMACIEVFALGGKSAADDAAESGYFATRAALAKGLTEAAAYMTEKGLTSEGAPYLARFIVNIASRFQLVVTEKVAATLVPLIGAAGGATINILFMDHFQDIARGHFIIRRLERKHGPELIRKHYDSLT